MSKPKAVGMILVGVSLGLVGGTPVCAQANNTTVAEQERQAELERIERERELVAKEKELLDQQKALLEAEKALIDQRIATLGLPQFENRTTLEGENAGRFEGMQLASASVGKASQMLAEQINGAANGAQVILLAGDEVARFGDAFFVEETITYHETRLRDLREIFEGTKTSGTSLGVAGAVETIGLAASAIQAVAGMFAAETTVSSMSLETSDAMLMRALAARIANGRRPDALFQAPENSKILRQFNQLETEIQIASKLKHKPGKDKDLDAKFAAMTAQLAIAKRLVSALTKPNAQGNVPVYSAARYASMLGTDGLVAQVHSEFSGGSVVTTKNLATRLGRRDPTVMSGGMVATYILTDPRSGAIRASGILRCRTPYTSVRQLQRSANPDISADCKHDGHTNAAPPASQAKDANDPAGPGHAVIRN